MGLRCECPEGHILNIKKELEGKQGICPKCGASFLIREVSQRQTDATAVVSTNPSAAVSPSVASPSVASPSVAPPSTAPPSTASASTASSQQTNPEPQPPTIAVPEPIEWRLANPQGEQFGPTVPTLFAQWINQGRVPPDWLVWRTGWSEWRRADQAETELPAPLPKSQPSETPPPLAAAASQKLKANSLATNELPSSNPSTSEIPEPSPVNEYTIRRKRAIKRQRTIIAMLGAVTLVLIGVLIWIALQSPVG